MGNIPCSIIILFSILLTLAGPDPASASTRTRLTRSLDRHFKNLNTEKSTLTKLQIFIHANFAVSDNQTVFQVATSEITNQSPTTFGRILIIDNPLTATSDPGSDLIGRYQGTNAYSDFRVPSANMNMNMIFYGGEYEEGSTISILGRQPVNEEVRVLSVIGGTGTFRMAKGVVLARTLPLDIVTKIGHYVYDMYLVTPEAGRVQAA